MPDSPSCATCRHWKQNEGNEQWWLRWQSVRPYTDFGECSAMDDMFHGSTPAFYWTDDEANVYTTADFFCAMFAPRE